jgi:hypothetical protein
MTRGRTGVPAALNGRGGRAMGAALRNVPDERHDCWCRIGGPFFGPAVCRAAISASRRRSSESGGTCSDPARIYRNAAHRNVGSRVRAREDSGGRKAAGFPKGRPLQNGPGLSGAERPIGARCSLPLCGTPKSADHDCSLSARRPPGTVFAVEAGTAGGPQASRFWMHQWVLRRRGRPDTCRAESASFGAGGAGGVAAPGRRKTIFDRHSSGRAGAGIGRNAPRRTLKELRPSVFFGSARASMRFRTAPGRQKPIRQGLRNGRSAAAACGGRIELSSCAGLCRRTEHLPTEQSR